MRILVFGNHTCANRGDAAILRGLLDAIRQLRPEAEVEVRSRYPDASAALMNRSFEPDPFYDWHRVADPRMRRPVRTFSKWAIPLLLSIVARTRWLMLLKLLPKDLRTATLAMRGYDLAIQVGGSFYVDLYGPGQFEHALAAIAAGCPVALLGHSMGPFGGRGYAWLTASLLQSAQVVALREDDSLHMLRQRGFPLQSVSLGSDTAWLVRPPARLPNEAGRPIVALTARDLAGFARRLCIDQPAYEAAMARLADDLIDAGYAILAVPTCTPFGGYKADDRVASRRIGALVADPAHFSIVEDELDDLQIGEIFSRCSLVVSTRLHGAIIAMNFGTPAVALAYEHKATGVMARLGEPMLAMHFGSLLDGTLSKRIEALLQHPICDLDGKISRERDRALAMVESVLTATNFAP